MGRYSDIVGVWTEPVIAQLRMILRFLFPIVPTKPREIMESKRQRRQVPSGQFDVSFRHRSYYLVAGGLTKTARPATTSSRYVPPASCGFGEDSCSLAKTRTP